MSSNRGQKFTIPKKTASTELFQELDPDSRQFKELASNIDNSFWNSSCGLKVKKIDIVNNPVLANEYGEKKLKMQKKNGRSTKELSEIYGFKLADNISQAKEICTNGLTTSSNSKTDCIGDPKCGVYLSRCADILTRASPRPKWEQVMLAFRIIKGRVKVISEQHGSDKVAIEPTPDFDGHFSKDFIKMVKLPHSNMYSKIFDSCQMFFYEFDLTLDNIYVTRPRQCLPYAIVHFSFSPPPVAEKVIVQPQIKVAPQKPVETETPPAAKPNWSDPFAPGSSFSQAIDSAQVLWTGKLFNKATTMTECKIVCYTQSIVKLPLLSDMLSFRMKMKISQLKKYLPKKLFTIEPLKSKTPKVSIHKREFLHTELYPLNRRSTSFSLLKRSLIANEEALRIKLPEDYDLFILPTCNLTQQLGITDEGYPEVLHLLFTSKVTDIRNIQGENSIFSKHAEKVRSSRVLEIEKQKLITPIEHPPPISDIDNDSVSPFHHHYHSDHQNIDDPIYFTSQERGAIRVGINRMRKAAKEEMMLSGKQFTIYGPSAAATLDLSAKNHQTAQERPSKIQLVTSQDTSKEDLQVKQTHDPRLSARSRNLQQSNFHLKQNAEISKTPYNRRDSYPRDPRLTGTTLYPEHSSQDLSRQKDTFSNALDRRTASRFALMYTRSASWSYNDSDQAFNDNASIPESTVINESLYKAATDMHNQRKNTNYSFGQPASATRNHALSDVTSRECPKTTANITQVNKPADPRLAARTVKAKTTPDYPEYQIDESQFIPFLSQDTVAHSTQGDVLEASKSTATESIPSLKTGVTSNLPYHPGIFTHEKVAQEESSSSQSISVPPETSRTCKDVTKNPFESRNDTSSIQHAYPHSKLATVRDESYNEISVSDSAKKQKKPHNLAPAYSSVSPEQSFSKSGLATTEPVLEAIKSVNDISTFAQKVGRHSDRRTSKDERQQRQSQDVRVSSSHLVKSSSSSTDNIKSVSVEQESLVSPPEKLFTDGLRGRISEMDSESKSKERLDTSKLSTQTTHIEKTKTNILTTDIPRQVVMAGLENKEPRKEQIEIHDEGNMVTDGVADRGTPLLREKQASDEQIEVKSSFYPVYSDGELYYNYEHDAANGEDNLVFHSDNETEHIVAMKDKTPNNFDKAKKSDIPLTMFDFDYGGSVTFNSKAPKQSTVSQEKRSSKDFKGNSKKEIVPVKTKHGFIDDTALHVLVPSSKQDSIHRKVEDSAKDGSKLLVTVISGEQNEEVLTQKLSVKPKSASSRLVKIKTNNREHILSAGSGTDLRDKLNSAERYGKSSPSNSQATKEAALSAEVSNQKDIEEDSSANDGTLKSVVLLPRKHSSPSSHKTQDVTSDLKKQTKSFDKEASSNDADENSISLQFKAEWSSKLNSESFLGVKNISESCKSEKGRSNVTDIRHSPQKRGLRESPKRHSKDAHSMNDHHQDNKKRRRGKRQREAIRKSENRQDVRCDNGYVELLGESSTKRKYYHKTVGKESEEGIGRKQLLENDKNKQNANVTSTTPSLVENMKATNPKDGKTSSLIKEINEEASSDTKDNSLSQLKSDNNSSPQKDSNRKMSDSKGFEIISKEENIDKLGDQKPYSKETVDLSMNWYDEEELKKFDVAETPVEAVTNDTDKSKAISTKTVDSKENDEGMHSYDIERAISGQTIPNNNTLIDEAVITGKIDGKMKNATEKVDKQTTETAKIKKTHTEQHNVSDHQANTQQDDTKVAEMEFSEDSQNDIEDISPPSVIPNHDQRLQKISNSLRKRFTGNDALQQNSSGVMQSLMSWSQSKARTMSMSLLSPTCLATEEKSNTWHASMQSDTVQHQDDTSVDKPFAVEDKHSVMPSTGSDKSHPEIPANAEALNTSSATDSASKHTSLEEQRETHVRISHSAPQEADMPTSSPLQMSADATVQQTIKQKSTDKTLSVDGKEATDVRQGTLKKLMSPEKNKPLHGVARQVRRPERGRIRNRSTIRPLIAKLVKSNKQGFPPNTSKKGPNYYPRKGDIDSSKKQFYRSPNVRGGKRHRLSSVDEMEHNSFHYSRRRVSRIADGNTAKHQDYEMIREQGKRSDNKRGSYDRHSTGYRQGAENQGEYMDEYNEYRSYEGDHNFNRDENVFDQYQDEESRYYRHDEHGVREWDFEREQDFANNPRGSERRQNRYSRPHEDNFNDYEQRYEDRERPAKGRFCRDNNEPQMPRFKANQGQDGYDQYEDHHFNQSRHHRNDIRNDSADYDYHDRNSYGDNFSHDSMKSGRARSMNGPSRGPRQNLNRPPKRSVVQPLPSLMDIQDGDAFNNRFSQRDNEVFGDEEYALDRSAPFDDLYRNRKDNSGQRDSRVHRRHSLESHSDDSKPFFGGLLAKRKGERLQAPRKRPARGRS